MTTLFSSYFGQAPVADQGTQEGVKAAIEDWIVIDTEDANEEPPDRKASSLRPPSTDTSTKNTSLIYEAIDEEVFEPSGEEIPAHETMFYQDEEVLDTDFMGMIKVDEDIVEEWSKIREMIGKIDGPDVTTLMQSMADEEPIRNTTPSHVTYSSLPPKWPEIIYRIIAPKRTNPPPPPLNALFISYGARTLSDPPPPPSTLLPSYNSLPVRVDKDIANLYIEIVTPLIRAHKLIETYGLERMVMIPKAELTFACRLFERRADDVYARLRWKEDEVARKLAKEHEGKQEGKGEEEDLRAKKEEGSGIGVEETAGPCFRYWRQPGTALEQHGQGEPNEVFPESLRRTLDELPSRFGGGLGRPRRTTEEAIEKDLEELRVTKE